MTDALKIVAMLLTAVTLAVAALGLIVQNKTEIPAGGQGKYLTVQHLRLRYVQKGIGPDLLLIHGTPASLEDWLPVIDRWATKYRVTAYDRPGHGYSDPPTSKTGIEYNAQIVRSLMAELQLRDVTIVGHSYGAAIALRLAIDAEARARSYVLVAGTAYPSSSKPMAVTRLLRIPLLGRGLAVLLQQIGGRFVTDALLDAFHPEEALIPPGYIDARRAMWLQPKVTLTMAAEMSGFNAEIEPMVARYPSIEKPVLVVTGSADKSWIVDGADRLTRTDPHSTLAVIQGSGHMVQLTQADALASLVEAEVTRSGSGSLVAP